MLDHQNENAPNPRIPLLVSLNISQQIFGGDGHLVVVDAHSAKSTAKRMIYTLDARC